MQILQHSSQLLYYGLAVILRKFLVGLLLEGKSQGDAGKVLHDDVQVVVGLDDIEDLHDVGVVKILKDFDLSSYCLLSWDFFDLSLLICLDSDLLVLRLEDGHSHQCVCSFSDHLSNHIILLELGGQVARVLHQMVLVLLVRGRKSSEKLVVLILHLKELNQREIPSFRPKQFTLFLRPAGFSLHLDLLIRLMEEFLNI